VESAEDSGVEIGNYNFIYYFKSVGVIAALLKIYCRLFRVIGGKGFEKVLGSTRNSLIGGLQPSAGKPLVETESEPVASSLMLRTLECRNIHSGLLLASISL